MARSEPPSGSQANRSHTRPEHPCIPVPEHPPREGFTYDAYGQHQPAPEDEIFPLDDWQYQFQGLRVDPNNPLFADRTRAMSPDLARWIEHEPLAYVDGQNAYVVSGDNPINAVNPLGT